MVWTVLGTVIPGVGLLRARRWVSGFTALLGTFALVGGLAYVASDRQRLFAAALTPSVLKSMTIVLVLVAILWAMVIAASHVALRPAWLSGGQRAIGGLLVGALTFATAAPLAVAARYSYDQASLVTTVFVEQESQTRPTIVPGTKDDVWLNVPRINVLLVGNDDSTERKYGDQMTNTDTMILASIDTRTGNMVLAGVPRNTMKMPFPKDSPLYKVYPNGWPEMANAMFATLPTLVDKNILGPTSSLGMDALKLSIGEALGVKVDYYVMVNLDGLYTLVDALGGVTVNISTPIAVGGDHSRGIRPDRYLQPGPNRKLTAADAMIFARSRYDADDFARMARQRCLILGIVKQADPATMLTRYEAISKAGSKMVRTDIPASMLPMFVELALRVKNGQIFGVTFADSNGWWVSASPDFARMKATVAAAISQSTQASAGPVESSAAPPPPATSVVVPPPVAPSTAKSTGKPPSIARSTGVPTPTQAAQNEADACAYNPPTPTPSASKR
jgi:LCP family protein required for cell wall assembly